MGIGMGLASVGLSAMSTTMGIQAAHREGKAAKMMAAYQAKLDLLRAGISEKQGAIKQRYSDIVFSEKLATAKTTIASSGLVVGAGSAKDYELDAVGQHAVEKSIIAENTQLQQWGFLEDAKMQIRTGEMASQAAKMKAIGIGISGVSSMLGSVGGMMGGGSASEDGGAPSLISNASSFKTSYSMPPNSDPFLKSVYGR